MVGDGSREAKNWPGYTTLPQVSFFSEINTAILHVNFKKMFGKYKEKINKNGIFEINQVE